jgi:hypothetical protein
MSIQVVNMIPQSLSGDTNFDSEPSVTVDPSDPQRLVGTAFRPDAAAGSTTGPYFFSADGGATWALNSVIPGGTSTFGQKDISVRFGPASGVLYAGRRTNTVGRGDVRGSKTICDRLKSGFSQECWGRNHPRAPVTLQAQVALERVTRS